MTDYKNSSLYTIDTTSWVATLIAENPLINEDWWDLTFDDNGDLYVIVKQWKLFKVEITWPTSTNVTFVWTVKYDWKAIASTWLVFKNSKFYVTDNKKDIYSFELSDLENATLINDKTNSINDLSSCPVDIVEPEPDYWFIDWYKFNDLDSEWDWDGEDYGLLGWTIVLTWLDEWLLTYTWVTDENWYYSFENIPVWDYKVCEEDQYWWMQTYPNTEDWCHHITIENGTGWRYNFGNNLYIDQPWYGYIYWYKFNDLDADWAKDEDEYYMSGWTIVLTRLDWEWETYTWVTDEYWHYSFSEIPEWNYKVCEVNQEWWLQSYPNTEDKCHHITVTKYSGGLYDFGNYEYLEPETSSSSGWWTYTWGGSSSWWGGGGGWWWSSSWGWSKPKLSSFNVEETVEAWPAPEDPDDGWIIDTYKDYQNKKKELKDITDLEKVEWSSQIEELPKILPKTWADLNKKVKIYNTKGLELYSPAMKSSYENDINYWKAQLPEIDRNLDEYIVLPSNGMVMPVNYIPKSSQDFNSMIKWKEIEYNNYLKNWALTYPWTNTQMYWLPWNRVIFGHSSNWISEEGRYKTQFQKIIELDAWEQNWIYKKAKDGSFTRYVYIVEKSYQTKPTDVSVLKPWVWSNLTLITCTPIW